MTNVSLNNGGTVLIGSIKDAIEAVDERLSPELACYINDFIKELESNLEEMTDEADAAKDVSEECERRCNEFEKKLLEVEREKDKLETRLMKYEEKESKAENCPDELALPF